MKWRAFSRMPQWVRLSEWLGGSGFATVQCTLMLTGEGSSETRQVMMPEVLPTAK
jgi:hypothetical protein